MSNKNHVETWESNGAKIGVYSIPGVTDIASFVTVTAGSYMEEGDNWGGLHLLEHMLFQGNSQFSRVQMENWEMKYALYNNGSCGPEDSNYNFRAPCQYLKEMVKFILPLMFNPTLPESVLSKEKNIIAQEYANKWNRPETRFSRALSENSTSNIPNYWRDGIGQTDFVQKLTIENLHSLHQKFYQPQNMTFCFAGNINKKDIQFLKKQLNFSQYPNTYKSSNPVFPKPIAKSKNFNYTDDTKEAKIVLRWSLPCKNDLTLGERIVAGTFSQMLTHGPKSILYNRLRTQLGLVYSVGSGKFYNSNLTFFEVYTTTGMEKKDQVIQEIIQQVTNFFHQPLDQKLYSERRQNANLWTQLNYSSSTTVVENTAYYLHSPDIARILTPKDLEEEDGKVDASLFHQKLAKYITPENVIISVMVPKPN